MKNNRVFILVIILSIVILLGLLFSVNKITSANKKEFLSSGYVNTYEAEEAKKIYFNEGTKYKNTVKDTISFKNSSDEKTEVSKYSFVIYENKNIGYLNNGVLLDLDEINKDFIPYYNIKSNYLIKYENDKYVIDTLNDDIILNNFIGKISDNKYIVVGNDIKLVKDNKEYESFYFEISFEEKNIIKITNNIVDITTVNDDTYIQVGENTKIDLINQKILYLDTEKLNLNEITITNSENIEIKYDDTSDKKSSDSSNGNAENNETVDNKKQNNIEETNNNNNNVYNTKTVIDYKTNPYLELLNVNVSASRISMKFNVEDPNNMLNEDMVTITIKDLETGISEIKHVSLDGNAITYAKDGLTSNHKYLVSIVTKYDNNYTLVLLQRTFTTNQIGIDLNVDYITNKSLDYVVNLADNSQVEAYDVKIYDTQLKVLETISVNDAKTNRNKLVSFENLQSNTEYIVRVENVKIGGVTYASGYAASDERRTLKTTPYDLNYTSTPLAQVNKKDGTVLLNDASLVDNDNSINNVEYRIYEINGENYTLIDTIKKSNLSDVTLNIKNLEGFDNTKQYAYDIKLTLYDNEKTIVYTTDKSNAFSFSNKVFPTASYENVYILNNTIKGKFLIYDPDSAITSDEVTIKYNDALGNEFTKNVTISTDEFNDKYVDVELTDLQGQTIYVIKLYAIVDIGNEDKPAGSYFIGATTVTTNKGIEVDAVLEQKEFENSEDPDENTENINTNVFKVGLKLSLPVDAENQQFAGEITGFTIELYEGYNASGDLLGTMHVNNNIAKDYFENEKILYLGDFKNSIQETLNLDMLVDKYVGRSIPKNYSLKLTNGTSTLGYIEFKEIGSNRLNFDIDDSLLDLSNCDAKIAVSQIPSALPLDNNITVGLKVTSTFKANSTYATGITYTLTDVTDPDNQSFVTTGFLSKNDDSIDSSIANSYSYIFNAKSKLYNTYESNEQNDNNKVKWEDFFKRGHVYKASYIITLDISGTLYQYPFSNNSMSIPAPVTSDEVFVLKKEPSMILYPYISDSSSIVYKYKVTDSENAWTNNIKYMINDTYYYADEYDCSSDSEYECFKINNLNNKDDYGIYLESKLIDRDNYDTTNTSVNTFNFDGYYNLDNVNYELLNNEYNNILALKINDSTDELLKRVVSYKLTLTNGSSEELVIDNITDLYTSQSTSTRRNFNEVYINSNGKKSLGHDSKVLDSVAYITTCGESDTCLYFDYSKLFNTENLSYYSSTNFKNLLTNFKDTDLNISLEASYDSGIVGYDNQESKHYAFKIDDYDYVTTGYKGTYMSLSGTHSLDSPNRYFYNNAYSSNFTYAVGLNESIITLTNYSYLTFDGDRNLINPSQNIEYRITDKGFEIRVQNSNNSTGNSEVYAPVVAKEISNQNIENLDMENNNLNISKIIPSIKLNESVSKPTLSGIKLSISLFGINNDEITADDGDNKYLYLYTEDNLQNKNTIKINLNNINGIKCTINNNGTCTLPEVEGIWYDVYEVLVNGSTLSKSDYSYNYLDGSFKFNTDLANKEITVKYYIVLNGLSRNTAYTLKAGVKLKSNDITYLVDSSSSTYQTFEKEFTTLDVSDISFSNISSDITSNADYSGRYINLSYNINDIIGLENISYEITYGDNIVNTNVYAACSSVYNNFGGTCINYDNTYDNYKLGFNFFAQYNDNTVDFVYGANYKLKIYAKIGSESHVLITPNDTNFDIRSLVDPTFNVIKKSIFKDNKYKLKFTIDVDDPDKVIYYPWVDKDNNVRYESSGYYNAYITQNSNYSKDTDVDVYDGTETSKIDSDYFSAGNLNTLVYKNNLSENTKYTLIIKYTIYKNNSEDQGKLVEESKLYPIFTLNQYGISPGLIDYDGSNVDMQTILRFSYASNIQKAEDDENQEAYTVGLNYNIHALSTIAPLTGKVLFNKDNIDSVYINNNGNFVTTSDYSQGLINYITGSVVSENVGDSYYELNFPTQYLSNARYVYEIQFNFYIVKKSDSLNESKDECLADATNLWITYKDNTTVCAKLADNNYTKQKNIGEVEQ